MTTGHTRTDSCPARRDTLARLAAAYTAIHLAVGDRRGHLGRWGMTDAAAYDRLADLLDTPTPAPKVAGHIHLIDRVAQYRDELGMTDSASEAPCAAHSL